MLRRLVFGFSLLSATMLSHAAFAENPRALQIIVSKAKQSLVVYDGEKVVATSRVSTGKSGHTTPGGIFSILAKEKYHESNIYSNAPMPWMQRLTWSGIALHEGVVPNYPASHGCIRLPKDFATSLYRMTEAGAHVIVTDALVVPERIEDVALFTPRKPLPSGPLLPDTQLRTSSIRAGTKPVEVAMNVAPDNPALSHDDGTDQSAAPEVGVKTAAEDDRNPAPLRILITRRGDRETLMDAQVLLEELGFDTGGSDGFAGPMTRAAIAGFKRWKNLSLKGPLVSEEFIDALYDASGQPKPPAGQIMVRQNFKPLFEAPVGIKDPEIALGTHLLTADKIDREAETAEWHAVTLPNPLPAPLMQRLRITVEDEPSVTDSAKAALDRIEIPAEIRERIETTMADGTSITINDQGLGPDTGAGTDFITITRTSAATTAAVEQVSETPRASSTKPPKRYRSIGLY
jgi:peptidoglycan hydrolase-like protein with peptidoglycan-binding domain